jgi:mRNA interferase RelE/StbE
MPVRVEWHKKALDDLRELDRATQDRIRRTTAEIKLLDDARQRLVPYVESLKGYWKLRVGDYRVVCELRRDAQGQLVMVIHVVHRGEAYRSRSLHTIKRRSED